ncbi:hypothetical protein [Salinibacterium sp. ZJ450]|uniref:hypothetical protein n=1 Tax=Salinibacterium sp. ZJ450 TaxID=2708338 RepID=UPI001420E71E|nr:hypothetical protein [Salinibacterium sp. ZJ450]
MIVVWCFVMLAFVGALWGAVASDAGWGPAGGWFLPALGLFLIGQALAAAAKRKGVNPTTGEAYPEGQPVGKSDPTRTRFIMAALRQMIVEDPAATQIDGINLAAADEILSSYHQTREANWGVLWQAAARTRSLPMYGKPPYWSNSGPGGRPVPLSYLAFWDTPDRMRAVRDNMTAPEVISLAATDPDRAVAQVAARKISLRPSD